MGDVRGFLSRLKLLVEELADGKENRLAEILGVHPGIINKWKKRENYPSSEHLINIKEKLGVNINWLLLGEGARYLPSAVLQAAKSGGKSLDKNLFWGDVEVDLVAVGKRLRQIRGDLTLKNASVESATSIQGIRDAEKGIKPPDPRYLYWASGYGDTFSDWIMTGEGPRTSEEADKLFKQGKISAEEYALVAERKKGYGQPITPDERELLELYRASPDEGKKGAVAVLSVYRKGK
ncbi:MAG: helix-turn-helix domain-containing protein [Nitrospinota bacterium]|nr:helix-turn-helix domain-containing protein [Nitrospinota bacterium]